MIFIDNPDDYNAGDSLVMVGKFDGFHKGHRSLVQCAIEHRHSGQAVVAFMFGSNPFSFKSGAEEKRITTIEELKAHSDHDKSGVDFLVEVPFTEEIMNTSARDFVKDMLVEKLRAKTVICGEDFRFGKGREGDTSLLKRLGEEYGFEVYILPKLQLEGADVSSTLIRSLISEGKIEEANELLGHHYYIGGEVIHGRRIGRNMGFPTINQTVPSDKVLPPYGVYATKALFDGREYISLTNIGRRPTFDDTDEQVVETHIFDFSMDVYGKYAEVYFYRFIRPEKKFADIDELAAEIGRNREEVLEYFNSLKKSQ